MAKTSTLNDQSSPELVTTLADSRRELFNLRFQLATGQLDNTARMGQLRRTIARILTELRTREIAEAAAAAETEGGAA